MFPSEEHDKKDVEDNCKLSSFELYAVLISSHNYFSRLVDLLQRCYKFALIIRRASFSSASNNCILLHTCSKLTRFISHSFVPSFNKRFSVHHDALLLFLQCLFTNCPFWVAGALMYLNEATLLNNVKIRYMKNAIYVSNSQSNDCTAHHALLIECKFCTEGLMICYVLDKCKICVY